MFRSYFFAGCGTATALFMAMACGSTPPSPGAGASTAGGTSAGGTGRSGTAGVAGSPSGGGTGATAGSGVSGASSAGASSGGAGGAASAGKGGGGAGGAGSAGRSGGGAAGAGSAGKSGGGTVGGSGAVENSDSLCHNGLDDDHDGYVDCDDPDCINTFYCPAAWTCLSTHYFDGTCDCGCGIVDGDCADPSPDSCMACDEGCADSTCSNLNPQDNSKCL